MARSVLRVARSLMSRRKFTAAIQRLESRSDVFEGDFEYYLLLGIAHLYLGDTGAAKSFFEQARRIRNMNTELLLGQAALLLQRGEVSRAVSYYTDILDNDPQNKVAKNALEFIRVNDDSIATIRRLVDTRKIEKFYPPLGFNTDKVRAVFAVLAAGAVVSLFVLKILPAITAPGALFGTVREATSVEVRRYVLTDAEIRSARKAAKKALSNGNYSEAVRESNRLLNSNALESVKDEAREVKRLCYPSPPLFDTAGVSYAYEDAAKDPLLYEGCYAVWTGRITKQGISNGVWKGLLSVSAGGSNAGGVAEVVFDAVPEIDMERDVSVLGRISVAGGKLILDKCKAHQSLKDKMARPD